MRRRHEWKAIEHDRLREAVEPAPPLASRGGRGRPGRRATEACRDGAQPSREPGQVGAARVKTVRLGIRETLAQFSLLVVVSALVGAMIGMGRTILPAIAEGE